MADKMIDRMNAEKGMTAKIKKLIDDLNGCYTNNGNARFIHYEGAEILINKFKEEVAFKFYQIGAGDEANEKYNLLNPKSSFKKHLNQLKDKQQDYGTN